MSNIIATYTQNDVTGVFEQASSTKWTITVRYQGKVMLFEEYNNEERANTNWLKLIIDPKFFDAPKPH